MISAATSVEEVREAVRGATPGRRLLPAGALTKPALSTSAREDVDRLELSGLSGIVEYDPAELTVTALAGTPVHELQATLAEHGQQLPFDPPLAAAGATLGGVVAAGASGPGAWRHGGVRDFVIGVRFVDGGGNVIAGGGRVVKNAAGFDFAKLLVGSIGRLGVIVQLSFKVFPCPSATTTLAFALDTTEQALAALIGLARGPVELEALEIAPGGRLLVRLGGSPDTLAARAARVAAAVGGDAETRDGDEERALWSEAAELGWAGADSIVVRVGLSVRRVLELEAALATAAAAARVRYGIGATVAWIAWPASVPLDELDAILLRLRLPGMALAGPADRALLGPRSGGAFAARVTRALDPDHRFLEI